MNNKNIKNNNKKNITPEEIIYIFEKTLEGWKTIKIFNVLIQNNPNSNLTKEMIEKISTGNSKINENELDKERYNYYKNIREKVYLYQLNKKKNNS